MMKDKATLSVLTHSSNGVRRFFLRKVHLIRIKYDLIKSTLAVHTLGRLFSEILAERSFRSGRFFSPAFIYFYNRAARNA